MTHDLTTFDGALAAIAELPCAWEMRRRNIRTRRRNGDFACPLCELEPTHAFATDLWSAAEVLDMPDPVVKRIQGAADYPSHPDRIALEIACKLRERAP